ncbi:putative methylaconitate Delta-isomerase PrpF [Agaricicola taiwanensis]|uniref:Putative methylaconitate Delta-isomerase PrpF n=1 Tax=Agaricicola taiwanensis TaxID=591372 RepID=A0A8J2VJJ5_9RHOB|nr:PrpF domain-containing protein [Agaricicola taiwanensis]GGE27677.1 putative methylaconitate Delta-isomerase PrpF [Agaricicola taiwanensis]
MPQARIRASFMRGGTSKAIMFRREDLPEDRKDWDPIFLAAMGSPDPNGRQLDGMGGGVSSLSKVCIVGKPSRPDADVDYTFAQVQVKDALVDYSGNCGNMSTAIGPFAVDEGLVPRPADGKAVVRIHNTNTSKIIVARFDMDGDYAAVDGDFAVDGIAGTAAPVRLEFTDPGGAKTGKLLPTGNARDDLKVEGLGTFTVSMVDAANPCIFVNAEDLGKTGTELPDQLEADPEFLEKLQKIRRAGSVAMGIAPTLEAAAEIRVVPFIAMVVSPRAMSTLSGRQLTADDMSIAIRLISNGQPHRAVPVTASVCLAVATRIEGSVPHALVANHEGPIRIAQPSGVTTVDALVEKAPGEPGGVRADHGAVFRTCRRLFEGTLLYRPRS